MVTDSSENRKKDGLYWTRFWGIRGLSLSSASIAVLAEEIDAPFKNLGRGQFVNTCTLSKLKIAG